MITRRDFISTTAGTFALAAIAQDPAPAPAPAPAAPVRRIRLGLIGCGGRGSWIANLAKEHGFDIVAGADYFPDRAQAFAGRYGLAADHVFSGLSGYRRLIDSGFVEAVAIESPPYFHPSQAADAVAAGLHVYLAKPVAVDVPGCQLVAETGRKATAAKRCLLVDFQSRANDLFIEAIKLVHGGALGTMAFVEGMYHGDYPFAGHQAAVRAAPNDPEAKLRGWGLDRALSGDIITEQFVHTLDIADWAIGREPVEAYAGGGLQARDNIGTCWDHYTALVKYTDGVEVSFNGRQFRGHDSRPGGIRVRAWGSKGVLEAEYGGQVLIRGDEFYRGGSTGSIYEQGARTNLGEFHRRIVEEQFDNPTVAPSVRSTMVTLLARHAAWTGKALAWADLQKSTERLEADLKGLKD
jgi:predicted dehydrogenase